MSTSSTLTITDPVGTDEIAQRLHVGRGTVYSWRSRRPKENPMPEPDTHITGTPVWSWHRIAEWAMLTGRLPATGSWDEPGTAMTLEKEGA
jgi:hypothetical protein